MLESDICTHADVADLKHKLDEIHALLADGILADLKAEENVVCHEDADPDEVSDAVERARATARMARREALQLLKQNGISAAAMPGTPMGDLARMAGKLNFQTLEDKRKVVPIRPPDRISA